MKLSIESINTLQHFLEQGWNIRVSKEQADVVKKELPFLKVTKENYNDKYIEFAKKETGKKIAYRNYVVSKGTKAIPAKILAEYWEYRYKELDKRYEDMYGRIKYIKENF